MWHNANIHNNNKKKKKEEKKKEESPVEHGFFTGLHGCAFLFVKLGCCRTSLFSAPQEKQMKNERSNSGTARMCLWLSRRNAYNFSMFAAFFFFLMSGAQVAECD